MNYLRGSRDVKGAGQLQSTGSTDALTAPLRAFKVRSRPVWDTRAPMQARPVLPENPPALLALPTLPDAV